MAPRYVRVVIDSIVVRRPDDMRHEPGKYAEWRVTVELPGGTQRAIVDDLVKAGKVFPLSLQSAVIDLQADPDARIKVYGREIDDSSANDVLPWVDARISTLAAGVFTLSPVLSRSFEYELRGSLIDLDPSPWHVVSPTGLAYYGSSEDNGVWYSGRAMAAVAFHPELAVVGADSGGLWTVPVGGAISHSDEWQDPNIRSILPHGFLQGRMLVGTQFGRLYDAGAVGAVGAATEVSSNPTRLEGFGGSINQLHLATLRGEPVWLMATSNGVWWSDSGFNSNRWRRAIDAMGQPFAVAAFSITAIGNDANPTIVVGLEFGRNGNQVATARFTPQGLVFDAAPIVTSPAPGNTLNTSVCASPLGSNPRLYLLCFEDTIAAEASGLFRSDNLGQTWVQCAMATGDAGLGTFREVAGTRSAGGLFRHVTIHPTDPDVVAVPGLNSQVSVDGGANSLTLIGEGFHADSHEVRLANPDDDTMVIASDGGVLIVQGLVSMTDFARQKPGEARAAVRLLRGDSRLNRFLPTLQLSGVLPASFLGTFAASSDGAGDGVIALGLQDNGLVLRSFSMTGEWRYFGGGDGTMVATTPGGTALGASQESADPQRPDTGAVEAGRLDKGLSAVGVPKVLLAGTTEKLRRQMQNDLVLATARGGGRFGGAPVYAAMRNRPAVLGGAASDVTLLELQDLPNGGYEWRLVPAPWPPLSGTVRSLSIDDGAYIALGTDQGEIAILEVATMSVRVPRLTVGAGPAPTAAIQSLDVVDSRGVYAVTAGSELWFIPFVGAPRQIQTWTMTNAVRLNTVLPPVAVAALRSHPLGLAVANERDVVISLDDGLTWRAASNGLPSNPHINGIKSADMGDEEYLILSTWGRSLWNARVSQLLDPAPVT